MRAEKEQQQTVQALFNGGEGLCGNRFLSNCTVPISVQPQYPGATRKRERPGERARQRPRESSRMVATFLANYVPASPLRAEMQLAINPVLNAAAVPHTQL